MIKSKGSRGSRLAPIPALAWLLCPGPFPLQSKVVTATFSELLEGLSEEHMKAENCAWSISRGPLRGSHYYAVSLGKMSDRPSSCSGFLGWPREQLLRAASQMPLLSGSLEPRDEVLGQLPREVFEGRALAAPQGSQGRDAPDNPQVLVLGDTPC